MFSLAFSIKKTKAYADFFAMLFVAGYLLGLVPMPDVPCAHGGASSRAMGTSRRAVLGGTAALSAGLLAVAPPLLGRQPVQAAETLRGAGVAVRCMSRLSTHPTAVHMRAHAHCSPLASTASSPHFPS